MKKYLVGFFYSLPVQLFLLHFRRFQVLLVFWYILFSTVNGTFLKAFGANSLYLSPEYLGNVNALSAGMVGFSIGIFIMSWNITTFILHARFITFLATTANPFLKYCLNNGVFPLIFLLFYLFKAIAFNSNQQLMSTTTILILIGGFVLGLALAILITFLYFFTADKTIYRRVSSSINTANLRYAIASKENPLPREKSDMRIEWFLTANLHLRKPRDVRHYSKDFLDTIFKRHHFAAVIAILIAISFLLVVGFFMDHPAFEIPAGASSTLFFAVLIAGAGAFSLFLKNWTLIFLIILLAGMDYLYEHELIDNRNKAYGLNYDDERKPFYNRDKMLEVASDSNAAIDKASFIKILNNWKARQGSEKPVMYFINVSGGGNRSAAFTMNVLQHLDSITGGKLMKQTMLINGASGGMLGAAYFRELYLRRQLGEIKDLQSKQYPDNISKDLLNPLFSSFVARDITAPTQLFSVGKYRYVKDRGYAFEQKFNQNTKGFLNKYLRDYIEDERAARIPLIFFNSVITRDGRKLIISSQPVRFMMKPMLDSAVKGTVEADAIDYVSYFKDLDPYNLRILSALRMNATFPYVLPNVWLPTIPEINVVDAGLRDNFGLENTLRFIQVFKDWLRENTSKIVLLQIRDRKFGDWEKTDEKITAFGWVTKPLSLVQNNLFRLQDFYQAGQLGYASGEPQDNISRIIFQYVPAKKDASATLSFHLTNAEKLDIATAIKDSSNQKGFDEVIKLSK